MRVDDSTGKGTYSMDKFSSKVHGVHIKLGGKLLYSLRIKTDLRNSRERERERENRMRFASQKCSCQPLLDLETRPWLKTTYLI
jgi:hypothetical protein